MAGRQWSGRFAKPMAPQAVEYGASIPFDYKLAPYDIEGSLAYCRALRRAGLLTARESQRIQRGLQAVGRTIAAGKLRWRTEWEDIHTHIERALIQKIGPVGGKLHTGRSRNDQVATDLRLYCMDQLDRLTEELRQLQRVLVRKAASWVDILMPGYTHLQRAQPVALAHHLLAYVEMLLRDEARLEAAYDSSAVLPLGAGALAGNPFQIDRQALARDLGFREVSRNSLDAVSDRDFAVEIAAAAALLITHLSRFAEEMILWASTEFGFLQLPQDYCTGSSMMPQKVNPDIPELVRGKTGRVFGDLLALLTVLKGLPLAYNKDLQEDKEALFDVFETLRPTVCILTGLLRHAKVDKAALRAAAGDDAMLATDLADWLVRRKLPFREAHEVTARLVRTAAEQGVSLKDLPLPLLKKHCALFTKDIYRHLTPDRSVAHRDAIGGTALPNVKRELARHRRRLGMK